MFSFMDMNIFLPEGYLTLWSISKLLKNPESTEQVGCYHKYTHITECTASVSCRLNTLVHFIILFTECSKTADLLAGTSGQDCLPYVHR